MNNPVSSIVNKLTLVGFYACRIGWRMYVAVLLCMLCVELGALTKQLDIYWEWSWERFPVLHFAVWFVCAERPEERVWWSHPSCLGAPRAAKEKEMCGSVRTGRCGFQPTSLDFLSFSDNKWKLLSSKKCFKKIKKLKNKERDPVKVGQHIGSALYNDQDPSTVWARYGDFRQRFFDFWGVFFREWDKDQFCLV